MSVRFFWVLSLVLLASLLSGGRLTAQDSTGAAVEAEIVTAPVEFDGAVLFHVRGVSSYPAVTRARLIGERLAAVAADRGIPVEALRVIDGPEVSQIVARNRPIMAVADADAILEQVQRHELAATHLARLRQVIVHYRAARSVEALRRNAVNSLLATIILALASVAMVWFWRWADHFLARRLNAQIQALEAKSFKVMRAERIVSGMRSALRSIRTAAFLAIGLVYVGFVLAQWPATRGASHDMIAFALGPLKRISGGIVTAIPKLAFLVALIFVIRLVLKLIFLFFEAVGRGQVTLAGFDADWARPTYKIARLAAIGFGAVVAHPYIPGSDSAAFKGVTVFLGIIVSLGSSTAISNIIAGYMITYRRAFRIGDRVKIGDAVGQVVEMRLQVTHLRSPKNEEVVIPNSQILACQVLNYTSLARTRGLILHTTVGIGYETPWRQVEAMLLTAADRTDGIARDSPPFVLEKALGDFSVTYELNVFSRHVRPMNELYADLHRNILDVFNEYGVQIMTPAYEGDPDTPKVVRRKDWYAAPAARPGPTRVESTTSRERS